MASGRLLLVFFLFSSSCFASSPVSARKVQLALYYETVCPYCSNFIVNYLAKIFENGLIDIIELDIIELDLIPYGNAKHGPNECVLNTVEACAISAWPDVSEHFSFIYYVESLVMEHNSIRHQPDSAPTGLALEEGSSVPMVSLFLKKCSVDPMDLLQGSSPSSPSIPRNTSKEDDYPEIYRFYYQI
ncbi:hypothetical protein COCNU_16G006210 [Cocos nucifera]|uniref:Gamma-interferon-inducible lysosomal thiol reductase n=1 Tax=Cocos nucifera TaxID=13894 RepID=A0A8K0NEE8_COCNU|nr:hypothetical protein COCNU_16G006210 [Cocos nucifera]